MAYPSSRAEVRLERRSKTLRRLSHGVVPPRSPRFETLEPRLLFSSGTVDDPPPQDNGPEPWVIDVQQAQDVPRAGPDLFHFVPGTPLTVTGPGVLGNDIDFEGDALTASLLQGPAHGTLELYPDGSFTYTPEPGFKGMDLFHYAVSDGEHSSSGTVYLDGTGGRPWAIVNDPALWGVWFSGVQAPEGMEIQALQAMFDQAQPSKP
jgi:hypothetical protein